MPKRDREVALGTNEASQGKTSSPAANFAQNLVDGKFWGQLLLYPLRQLPEDFDNLSRKIHIVSSTIRTLSAVVGILAGGVAVFYWPWLSGWVSTIVSAYFGETIAASTFGGIIKAYVGGMLVGSISKFSISDIVMRLVNGCIYGNPDYYLTKSDIKRLSAKFSTTEVDISEEEVEEMGRSLITAIESNSPIPGIEEIGGREVYIQIFKSFLAGDITSLNRVIDIQEAVDNQLEEAERKLDELLHLTRKPAPLALDEADHSLESSERTAASHLRRTRSEPSLADADETVRDRSVPRVAASNAAARWQSAFQSIRRRGGDGSLHVETDASTDGVDDHFANDLLRRIEEAKLACQKARNQRRRPMCGAHIRSKLRRVAAGKGALSRDGSHRDVVIDITRLQTARGDGATATRSPIGGLDLGIGDDDGTREREVVVDDLALDMPRRDGGSTLDLEAGIVEPRRTSSPRRSPSPRS